MDIDSVTDAAGNLRIGYKNLSPEEMESLRALAASPFWAVYRKLLIAAMGEYMRSSTMVTNVDGVIQMIHKSGLAAGINFSINQLSVLLADYDQKKKKALEKEEKTKQPFKRG